MKNTKQKNILSNLFTYFLILSLSVLSVSAANFVDLGAASDFTILSHAGITNVPSSAITGAIGTDGVGASIGVTCSEVTDSIYTVDATFNPSDADTTCNIIDSTLLGTAMLDLGTAYTTGCNGQATEFLNAGSAGEIGGLTLAPGVYTFDGTSSNVIISTDLTLSGSSTDVWVFQIPGTFENYAHVNLLGGAQAKNIFWAVAGTSGTTLYASSTTEGNILGYAKIAMQAGATLNGRAMSQTESVTLISDVVNFPVDTTPSDTTPPVITLIGNDTITMEFNSTYNDSGATALDDTDGNITADIIAVNPVNTSLVGNYTITFDVTDAAGNPAVQVTRTVNVVDIPILDIIAPYWNETLTNQTIEYGTNLSYDANATDNVAVTEYLVNDTNFTIDNTGLLQNTVSLQVGTYVLTVSAKDAANNENSTEISIIVQDTVIPVITILGTSPVDVEFNSTYNDSGATALDNYDGNITANIIVGGDIVDTNVFGTYVITYDVNDSSLNSAVQVTRTVNVVDTTAPVITLLGNNSITLVIGDVYADEGATALDNYDGNITENITTINPVDTNTAGTYVVTYDINDSNGNNAATVTRNVRVNLFQAPTTNSTTPTNPIANIQAVDLGTAGNFAILTKSGISTTGITSITGNIGVSPVAATYITGFGLIMDSSNEFSTSDPASLVIGNIYASDYAVPTPSVMTTAVSDMETAYTDAAGRTNPTATEFMAGDISGQTLAPGLYKWSTDVLINSGSSIGDPNGVTLDCQGNADSVFIFQIAQKLTVGSNAQVTLIGSCEAKNIFWQVAGTTTLGTTSVFEGTILAQTNIAIQTGATLNGRALSQTAVTLDADTVTIVEAPQSWKRDDYNTAYADYNITLNATGFNNTPIAYINYTLNGVPGQIIGDFGTILISENGNNTLTFYAVDESGNIEQTQTIYAPLDKIVPVITSFTLSATNVNVGTEIIGTCTVDDGSTNTTGVITGIDTATAGTRTATCTATDSAGNIATPLYANYTVNAVSSGGSGGGGGGGGGSNTCTPNVQCTALSACIDGYESSTCTDINHCIDKTACYNTADRSNCIATYTERQACLPEVTIQPKKLNATLLNEGTQNGGIIPTIENLITGQAIGNSWFKPTLWAAILALLVIVGLVIGGYFLFRKKDYRVTSP